MGAAADYDLDCAQGLSIVKNEDFRVVLDEVVPMFYTNILLVEDDSTTSSFIKTMIKKILQKPLRIRSFTSAEKAFWYVCSMKRQHMPGPDLAIIDYFLSGERTGLWLLKVLENRFPETRGVLMSSIPSVEMKTKMADAQVNPEYIQKPILLGTLNRFLDL